MGTGAADECASFFAFVARKIIGHDNIAWFQRRQKLRLYPRLETNAIDGPVQDPRCVNTVRSQRGHEREGFPVPVWGFGIQACAFGGPSPQPCHIRLNPCFIQEYQSFGNDLILTGPPPLPMLDNLRAILFFG